VKVSVVEGILSANDEIARQNRQLLDQHGICVINLMASPGSGKTCLILRTIDALPPGRADASAFVGPVALGRP
jgi:hydrogenase nickel incorporation protein HypB